MNGYPQLPNESLQNRYPFGWWDIQERKNFGEVVSFVLPYRHIYDISRKFVEKKKTYSMLMTLY